MKLSNMVLIYFFLMAVIAVTAMNLDPKSAALAFKHLNATLAPGALQVLQSHGLWTPSTAGLNGLEPMFGGNYNEVLENERFEASGLDVNDLVHLSVFDDNRKNFTEPDTTDDETGIVSGDIDACIPYPSCCDTCHKCEEACLSGVIFFIIGWIICSGACWAQAFCKGCD